MTRPHWDNAIAHFDDAVGTFVAEYFGPAQRKCLLIAAAGFNPRSRRIATLLSETLGTRLNALFIREERGKPDAALVAAADANEAKLREMVSCDIFKIDIFGEDDAPVAGARIARALATFTIPDDVTDVVLDMTALSIGIGFPTAKLLLGQCEARDNCAFHLMIASSPEIEDRIMSEAGGRPMAVRGFAGEDISSSNLEAAKVWLPQLAKGKSAALDEIGRTSGEWYKICPVVPFPAGEPRRADALLDEYGSHLVNNWQVDPRDMIYASERNPLDCYRTLTTFARRYRAAVADVFAPSIVITPIGSKVVAAGAMMAALEHDLTVQYMETVRYDFDPAAPANDNEPEYLVHLLLSGPVYQMLDAATAQVEKPAADGQE